MDAVSRRDSAKTVEIESWNIYVNQRLGLIQHFQPS